jgi:PncC family amidohydrolase
LIAKRLTDFAGSSEYFSGGVVAYDNRGKVELLGVSERTIRQRGAVSEATAREMVEGVCRLFDTTAGVSVTGIAGPGGGTDEKPVGTVWLGARFGEVVATQRKRYPGTRDVVRLRAAQGGLDLLRRTVQRESM